MEQLIHYIWKYRLYSSGQLYTTTGIPFSVIDPGIHNTHAGPDFFNAKICIEDKVWAGNVEIHTLSSDWRRHEHHLDSAYDSVILHLVENADIEAVFSKNGRSIPQAVIQIPDEIRNNYEYLVHADKGVPCVDRMLEIPEIHLTGWKNALFIERLEQKTGHIFQILDRNKGDWEEALYMLLCRNFGFGINGDAFELLAKSLPFKCIQKHQDNPLQVEALLLGQAGLLEEEGIDDPYYLSLQEEYRFLRKKFDLQPLEDFIFKRLRIRPNNFPHVKLAQLAAVFCQGEHFFSKILSAREMTDYIKLFTPETSAYWKEHYHFKSRSPKNDKKIGLSALHIILINTVVPLLFAYGKKKKLNDFVDRSIQLMESLPSEKNNIITLFSRAGVKVCHAADSQALIQLRREYCEKKKCLFCRIGHQLLSNPGKSDKFAG
ncbi:MAG: DUF2851 family protein [Dysgonamonadaceae bacterium]|jgi:hypothetical protein|nr:DUF2851 family protein [Dysgonamonadaceae bacterium]